MPGYPDLIFYLVGWCDGAAGIAQVRLAAAGRAPGPLAAILNTAITALHRAENPWPSGFQRREEMSGPMLGNAGIGGVFLRLAERALGSVLLPSVATRRDGTTSQDPSRA